LVTLHDTTPVVKIIDFAPHPTQGRKRL